MSIFKLPNELLESIFTYYILLSCPSQTLQLVCRRWNAIAQDTPILKSRIIYLSRLHLASTTFYPQFLARCASSSHAGEAIERLRGGRYEFTYTAVGMTVEELGCAPLPVVTPPDASTLSTIWHTFSRQCTKLHLHFDHIPVGWLHHFPRFYALKHLEISNPPKGVIKAILRRVCPLDDDRPITLVSLTVFGERNEEILAFSDLLGGLKTLHVETAHKSGLLPFDKLFPLLVQVRELTLGARAQLEVQLAEMMAKLPAEGLLLNLTTLDAPGQLVGRLPQSVIDRLTHLTVRSPSKPGVTRILFPTLVHLTMYGLWLDMIYYDAPRLRELVLKDSFNDSFYDNGYTLTRLRPKVLRMTALRSVDTLLLFVEDEEGVQAPFGQVKALYVEFTSHVSNIKSFITALEKPETLVRLKHLVMIPQTGQEGLSERWRSKLVKARKKRADCGVRTLQTIRCT